MAQAPPRLASVATVKGGGPTSREVIDLMKRTGSWYTRDEVAKALDAPQLLRDKSLPGSTDPLLSAVLSEEAFCVAVPGIEGIPFYHAVPDGGSQPRLAVAHFASVYELPPGLMENLVRKVDGLHRQGRLSRPTPLSIHVMISVNQHLAGMSLLDSHSRPVHGLQYPCNWYASDIAHASCGAATKKMAWVSFTGIIKNVHSLIPPPLRRASGSHNHYDAYSFRTLWTECTIRQYYASATVQMRDVAWCMVNTKTLEMVDAPPRQTIVRRTKQLLMAAANHTDAAVPFTPIKCRFSLLTDTQHRQKSPAVTGAEEDGERSGEPR